MHPIFPHLFPLAMLSTVDHQPIQFQERALFQPLPGVPVTIQSI